MSGQRLAGTRTPAGSRRAPNTGRQGALPHAARNVPVVLIHFKLDVHDGAMKSMTQPSDCTQAWKARPSLTNWPTSSRPYAARLACCPSTIAARQPALIVAASPCAGAGTSFQPRQRRCTRGGSLRSPTTPSRCRRPGRCANSRSVEAEEMRPWQPRPLSRSGRKN